MYDKTSLIIGEGEIGKGLYEVLNGAFPGRVFIRDVDPRSDDPKDVYFLHITFPFSEEFVFLVQAYANQYQPQVIIVHGTVPPGTCRKIGHRCVSSPTRGKHPRIAEGIKTFVKFVGGIDEECVRDAEELFNRAWIKTLRLSSPEACEVGKIMETTQYGWFIGLAKEIKRVCLEYDVPFDEVYTLQNMTYNDGYRKLGLEHFMRPTLVPIPGKMGGHCVVENCDLLFDSVTRVVKELDKKYENDPFC